MAVNVLGNAWLQITPKWVGLDRMGGQLQQQIRIPMARVADSIRETTTHATRLGAGLADAGDNAANLRRRLEEAQAEARATAADVDVVRQQLTRAEAAAAAAADKVGGSGDAAQRAATDVETLRTRLVGSEAAAEGAAAAADDLQRRLAAAEGTARTAAGNITGIGDAASAAARQAAGIAGSFGDISAAASGAAGDVSGIGAAAAAAAGDAAGLANDLQAAGMEAAGAAEEAQSGWSGAFQGLQETGSGSFDALTAAAMAFGLGLEDAISDAAEHAGSAADSAADISGNLGGASPAADDLRRRLAAADTEAAATAADTAVVREQLARVEAAAARAAAQFGTGSDEARRAAGDVDVLRRRVTDAEQAEREAADAAAGLRRQLDDAAEAGRHVGDAADHAGSRWGKALDGVKLAGAAAFTGIGAVAAGGFASALNMEPVIDKMVAGIGAVEPLASDLGKAAADVYAGAWGDSMEDVAGAIEAVWKSGAITSSATTDELEAATAAAFDLSNVMGEEVGPVMVAVGQMVKTGLAANATEAFDIIARGQQLGLNKAEDLLDTFNEYSTQFRKLGLDGKEALGLISQGLRGGARDADIVADAFKEFSIRSIDGSKLTGESLTAIAQESKLTTAEITKMTAEGAKGLKGLGLDAEEMSRRIAMGGPTAKATLGLIIERLNAMKDPIERDAVGVGLFGSQWEDLGDAFRTLDVSTAVGSLGQVDGAMAGLSKTINDNAKTNLESFKRQVEMTLVNALGGAVGALREASGWLATNFGPALDTAKEKVRAFFTSGAGGDFLSGMMPGLRSFGDFVTNSLWPALKDLGGIGGRLAEDLRPLADVAGGVLLTAFNTLGWLLSNVIGPALSGLTGFIRDNQTLFTALAVAIGAGVGAWYLYKGAVAAVEWAQYLWQVRTLLMQAVMRGVQGTIAAVRGAMLLLNSAFLANPIGLIIAAIVALVAGFAYLWTHSEGFRNFWIGLWNGILAVLQAVGRGFMTFLGGVVSVLQAIGAGVSAFIGFFVNIWTTGFSAVVNLVTGWVNVVQGIFTTVFGAIKAFFEIWWTVVSSIFRVAFEVIRGIISFFVNIFKGDWEGAWNAIKDTTHKVLDIVRGAIDKVLGAIQSAFRAAVDGIGKIWDGIKKVAAVPVNFVIGTVYNNGIRKAFNFVAGLIGVGKLPEASLIGMRRGGRLPGYGGGDTIPALLEAGETVVDKDRTRLLAPVFAAAGVPGFKGGGLLGSIWDATGGKVVSGIADIAGKAIDWVRGALADGMSAALGPVRAGIRAVLGGGDDWKGWLGKLALKPLDALVDWVRKKDEETMPKEGIGGGVQRWAGIASAVLKELGQPLSWLPVLLRRMNQESGGNPRAINLWDSNAKAGHPSQGLMQTIPGTFNAYAGQYRSRGILDPYANIYAATRYTLARYGTLAAWNRPGGYDNGGPLHPGWTLAYNGTGHDEYVVNPSRRPGAGATITVANGAIQIAVDAHGAADPHDVEAAVRRASTDMLSQLTVLLRAGEGAA